MIWQQRKLSDIARVVTGKTPPTHDGSNFDGAIPFVCPEDLDNEIYLFKTKRWLSEKGANYVKVAPEGSILFSCIGNIGKMAVAGCDMRTNQQINCVIPEKINNIFAYYALHFRRHHIARLAGMQTVPLISKTEFENVLISVPPLDEQERIVEILSDTDAAIATAKKIYSVKQKRLDTVRVQLIFDDIFSREKLISPLIQISERKRSLDCNTILSVTNEMGFVSAEDQFGHRVASADVSNYKVVRNGQFAYNPSRLNVGSIARLCEWDIGLVSPMYVVLETKKDKLLPDFFRHWLQTEEAKQRIRLSVQGSVRESVSFNDLCSLPIPLPSLNQQSQICSLLAELENELGTHLKLIQAIKKQKHGLMQKLLTGKIPVSSVKQVKGEY